MELIYMYDESFVAKFRERYAGRRIEDKAVFGGELTHPFSGVGSDRKTETLPLKQEMIMDFGRMLSQLTVRELNGKFIRTTDDREKILEKFDPWAYKGAGVVLAPQSHGMVGNISTGYNGAAMVYASPQSVSGSRKPPVAKLTSGVYSSTGANDANSLAQLFIRGFVSGRTNKKYGAVKLNPGWVRPEGGLPAGTNSDSTAAVLDFIKTMDEGQGIGSLTNPLSTDVWATQWLHSSALSFIYQWRKELESIASQTQYLSQELVGFYEKGLKGDFLRHYSDSEVVLLMSLVELGAALRRNYIVMNCDGSPNTTFTASDASMSEISNGYKGSINLFWWSPGSYHAQAYNSNGEGANPTADGDPIQVDSLNGQLLYTPWWLSLGMDRYHFEHEGDPSDQRDIHREDLFHGLKILMEAASFEYGMIVPSHGKPFMDFFAEMDDGKLPDLTVMDDVKMMRTLNMVGYDSAEDYVRRKSPNPLNAKMEYFSDFITDGTINLNKRDELRRDMNELDSHPFVTGNYFKQGQQMVGPFEHTVDHRLTRFGAHSVDVKYIPYVIERLTRHKSPYKVNLGSGVAEYIAAGTGDDNAKVATQEGAPGTHYVDWLAFPSINSWVDLCSDVVHPCAHPTLGYGTYLKGDKVVGVLASTSANLGLGKDMYVDTNDGAGTTWTQVGSTQDTAALCPADYWILGYDGMLLSLVRRLNDVYRAWEGRTSGLFRRSELKGMLNWQSYNLKRELKAATPDAFFSKFGKEMMGFMTCSGAGFDPAIATRLVDRALDNFSVHNRTATGINHAGESFTEEQDVDTLVTPFVSEANSIEDVFFASHLLSYLTGGMAMHPRKKVSTSSNQTPAGHSGVLTSTQLTGGSVEEGRPEYLVAFVAELTLLGSPYSPGSTNNANWYTTPDNGAVYMRKSGSTGAQSIDATYIRSNLPGLLLGQRRNLMAKEISWYPLRDGLGIRPEGFSANEGASAFMQNCWWLPGRTSAVKTFFHSFKSIDGDETRVTAAPIHRFARSTTAKIFPVHFAAIFLQDGDKADLGGTTALGAAFNESGATWMPLSDANAESGDADLAHAKAVKSMLVYNMRLETLSEYNKTDTTGGVTVSNGTSYDLIAGHRALYENWRLFGNDTPGSYVQALGDAAVSPCSHFGLGSVPSPTGSSLVNPLTGVDAALGYRTSPAASALSYNLGGATEQAFAASTFSTGSFPIADEFSNSRYMHYLEDRSGNMPLTNGDEAVPLDLRLWRERAPKLLIFDQDVLDKSEAMLGVNLYMLAGVNHPGQITYVTVLGAGGDVDYEIRDSYGWSDAVTKAVENEVALESSTGEATPTDYTVTD